MPHPRALPSVDQVLRELNLPEPVPHTLLTSEVRAVLSERRQAMLAGQPTSDVTVVAEVEGRIRALLTPSLRRVINATGVILHTNLGRAPLSRFQPISGSSNLEFDLSTGKRGKRDGHIAPLLHRLLGASAIAVNNNAAAVFLVLRELAAGYEVIVSRGELIEIGDGFRIPEIMASSGAILREVGTTNKTRMEDYQRAITPQTRLILRVHPSNFHVSGFTSRPSLEELSALGRQHGIPVYEDLGSGCLVDLRNAGIEEPLVSHSIQAGVDLVSFSTDKLLGGPQSGIIAGNPELVGRVRRNSMYRAMRLDKLVLQNLECVLRTLLLQQWNNIPTLSAIFSSESELERRANTVALALGLSAHSDVAPIGGGSTPDQTLPTWVVSIPSPKPHELLAELRRCNPPVIGRISEGRVLLDLRSVQPQEVSTLIEALRPLLRVPPDNVAGHHSR